MKTLRDKSVIVTGAGAGLGRAYAIALAEAGACVVAGDVAPGAAASVAEEITAGGGRAVALEGSVADWDASALLTKTALERFGRLDALINNAGIARHRPPWDESEDDLRATAEVNILGAQFAARHALRAMVDSGRGGVVINVISGARLGIKGMSSYGASKGAVAAMTLNWALEAAEHGIRVNAISPLAQTSMAVLDTRSDAPPLPDPGRIAPLVVALVDDRLASLTGALMRFDGERLSVYRESLTELAQREGGWEASALVDAIDAMSVIT